MADDRTGSAARAQAAAQAVHEQGIEALQAGMACGRYTAQDLVRAYLARIAAFDQRGPVLNAIAALAPDAMAQARMREVEFRKVPFLPLRRRDRERDAQYRRRDPFPLLLPPRDLQSFASRRTRPACRSDSCRSARIRQARAL